MLSDQLQLGTSSVDDKNLSPESSSVLKGEPETNQLAVGTRVECRWKGGPTYFRGRISQLDGEYVYIEYEDGDKEWTTGDLIRLADSSNLFALGSIVQCRWKGGHRFYPGKVTEIDGDRFHIHYDDGDEEWTTADMLKK